MKKSKKILSLITLVMVLSCAFPVFAKNIASCDSSIPGAIIDEKLPTTVSAIVTIIKIAVPVILVIFGMLDLFKGIMSQKEDEIKKSQQIFIKRLISGVLVFFVFVIVQFIIGFVADAGAKVGMMDCVDCFINNNCTYK